MTENIKVKNIEQKKAKEKLKESIIKNSMTFISSPILNGLNKLQNLNFMNPIIQCLSHTKMMTEYFLNQNNKKFIINKYNNSDEPKLSPIYQELIQKLWTYNEKNVCSSFNLKNTIENINPLLKNGQTNAKDLTIFILEQLHNELKKDLKINDINNSNINLNNNIVNYYDKNNVLNNFFEEFKKQCSIISDIFCGFKEITNICLNCLKNDYGNNSKTYNYDIFKYIIFPLDEIKKYLLDNNEINQNNNSISINNCFQYNQREVMLNRKDNLPCNKCNQICNYISISRIFSSPNVLILLIERGKNNNINLEISENIDITEFVIKKDKENILYELYGAITVLNLNNPDSDYISSIKNSIDNKWYRYNNEIITEIFDVKNEVLEYKFPYILFYKKK